MVVLLGLADRPGEQPVTVLSALSKVEEGRGRMGEVVDHARYMRRCHAGVKLWRLTQVSTSRSHAAEAAAPRPHAARTPDWGFRAHTTHRRLTNTMAAFSNRWHSSSQIIPKFGHLTATSHSYTQLAANHLPINFLSLYDFLSRSARVHRIA